MLRCVPVSLAVSLAAYLSMTRNPWKQSIDVVPVDVNVTAVVRTKASVIGEIAVALNPEWVLWKRSLVAHGVLADSSLNFRWSALYFISLVLHVFFLGKSISLIDCMLARIAWSWGTCKSEYWLPPKRYSPRWFQRCNSLWRYHPWIQILYHKTSYGKEIAKSGVMRRGKVGASGPGIYFANSEVACNRKARSSGWVVLAKVWLGSQLTTHDTGDHEFKSLRKQQRDSVKLRGLRSGDEFIVYNQDQVEILDVYLDGSSPCFVIRIRVLFSTIHVYWLHAMLLYAMDGQYTCARWACGVISGGVLMRFLLWF
mmetsp:Transcript_13140/g.24463  ORF Transcript_13140/g.24463 Transcript_13140/m.24463 type:complete len:312 (+) Transcript_13140:2-937(+)